jgi:fumarate reductase subunit C
MPEPTFLRPSLIAEAAGQPIGTARRIDQMRSKPLSTDGASPISGEGSHKRSLKQRVVDEVIEFSAIVFYLWVMFGVFALHESVVSGKDHINYHFYGFAIVNALILGKVMLIAEDLHFADWFKDRPLVYPILCKAVAFSILFLVIDVVEEVIVGVVKGMTIGQSIPSIGGGSVSGVIFVGIILAIALIPFFAFREVGRVLGERVLHSLVFTEGAAAAFPSRMSQGAR